ncbi:MAG: MFS transporter [Deltaproteobacteria bacterium]|nr:MFS transporter [Deltaproteobacteria bacterium]
MSLLRSLYYRIAGLYFGWRMIAVGSVLRILGGGLYFYGFSVFFLPLSQDLDLNRAATSLVFSLARAQGAFEGPIAGHFMDRHGPRPLMIMAILCAGVGHMLLAGVHSYAMLVIVYMGVVSLAFHAGFMDAPMLIANTWFIRQRTMAMALISGSIGIGGFLFTPLLSSAVHTYGWRQAAFGCGMAFIVIGLPLAFLVRRSPESMGLEPDGDGQPIDDGINQTSNPRPIEALDFTWQEAIKTSAFWFITGGTAIRVIVLSAINVHYVALMVWKGMTPQRAAVFLAAQAFMSLPSHLLFGWLGDRVNKPRLMAICMLVAASSMLLLVNIHAEWTILIFTALFSVVESTFPVNWSTVEEYFGRKNFAKIRGSMSFVSTWGSVIGPVAAGAIYDQTKSYEILIWSSAALLLLASVLYGWVTPPKPQAVVEQVRA